MKSILEYIGKHKLMLIKWIGKWDMEEYKQNLNSFVKNSDNIDIKYIIQDITDLEFEINFEELDQLINIRKDKIKQNYKVVYITNKPTQVVFSELYSGSLPNKRSHMYCSSEKEALKLLSINMPHKELEDRFIALKNG